jgi:hypothetical protein
MTTTYPYLARDTKTGKYIVRFDATALRSAVCLLKFWRNVIDGYRSHIHANDIEFGIAFHIFTKELELTGSLPEAVSKAQDYFRDTPMGIKSNRSYLTIEYLTATCIEWHQKVYLGGHNLQPCRDKNSRPTVEQNFAIQILETPTAHYLLQGTIDWVGKHNDVYVIRDYKTTGAYKPKDYFKQYRLSHQMLTYLYAWKWFVKTYGETSEFYSQFVHKRIGVMIDGIFVSSGETRQYAFSDTFFFTDKDLMEYEGELLHLIGRMDQLLANGWIPNRQGLSNGACSGNYGECPFFVGCAAPDEYSAEVLLKREFKQEIYNPLDRDKNRVKLSDISKMGQMLEEMKSKVTTVTQ